jgi:amidophosphoribosyltransferase
MSEQIKHECGIVVMRLLKPLEYYKEKYGSVFYGLNKLYLLMEKQHNRGQDGAGALCLKVDLEPGYKYINRRRSAASNPIIDVFDQMYSTTNDILAQNPDKINDVDWCKQNLPFLGELYMGHLRYGTFGRNNVEFVHPVMRLNNWRSRTLVMGGNFNLTNVDELFQHLINFGQHPKDYTDTVTALEEVGLYIDEENQKLFREYKNQNINNKDISNLIEQNIPLPKVLKEATAKWDGGYAMAGFLGHGDAFVMRDPWGIRSAFYYHDDEIAVVTSERPVIQTALNVSSDKIKELEPGSAIIIKKNGEVSNHLVRLPETKTPCSFERIYFSRGTDKDIYQERKDLGEFLVPRLLEKIDFDFENTVFSFIPNTAETAFYGMLKGLETHLNNIKLEKISKAIKSITKSELETILNWRPRVEKIAVKDLKLRTFITQDEDRNNLVEHIYDITYGTVVSKKDTLVIVDDSIVRGTTLRQSILKILDRLEPKKIIIVSSAPQIRYPDCYGIDMTKIGDFIAFNAAISLLKESKQEKLIEDTYKKCKAQENLPKEDIINYVKDIYKPFSPEQISTRIAEIIKTDDINADFDIIFQSIEDLHKACPNNKGDWYFTGNYPTAGGNKVVNTSFINYYEGNNKRAY